MTHSPQAERLQGQLINYCEDLNAHVKLLRDYATTPDNVWLARGELNQIGELTAQIDMLLTELKSVSNA